MNNKFEGSFVALITPFKGGKVDEKTFRKLIDFQIANGTDAIVPCGTTGESATLTHEEHRRLMSIAVEHVSGRVPVICGAGSNATLEGLGLIQHAKKINADGVLVVNPYYNKPTQEGLYRHYAYLASKESIPFILYNIPGRTGINMAPETVARLRKEFSNIVAIKEASGSLDQVSRIISLCDITVLSGDDSLTLPMMSVGGRGVISAAANVIPKEMADLTHAALSGDYDRAQRVHHKIFELLKLLFVETNPIPVKTALAMMGMTEEEFRLPLCEMAKGNRADLKNALTRYGILRSKKVKTDN
ncbi:MAG TPA: 4-hydroxy-tetrahydrodipicolinate synthase [Candidatus Omnitrophota bacterium]|nr:4-hydroxy-tetrahydrodipicolinate synthase [Candidatus Omnitrophota bacterium]